MRRQKATEGQFSRHSKKWSNHFRRNLEHMAHVPWHLKETLSSAEREAIGKSIAVFQLGENAEGHAFKRAGKLYADEAGDTEYLDALDLFIREEQRHSAVLGRFMDAHGIVRIEKEWSDSVFRYIRRMAGLNVCITVLITAEIIAAVYYQALGRATKSTVLRAICGQILVDETYHLKFQASTLSKERLRWNPLRRWFYRQLHRFLLMGTILVIWKEHRSVYRASGLSLFRWFAMTWSVLEGVLLEIETGMRQSTTGEYYLALPSNTSTTHNPDLPSSRFVEFDQALGVTRKSQLEMQEVAALFE